MKLYFTALLVLVYCLAAAQETQKKASGRGNAGKTLTLQRQVLEDKIKGGWAGQTIGVTYGGPVEFRFNGTMIQEYFPIPWYDGYLKNTMTNNPGLYDDIYMDLTFVDVIEKEGMDAPASSFSKAFANAGYSLWHANQSARYNIQHGIEAPASGHWLNNPHADCIDYQIESDYAGLMSPGMPNSASAISDKIGHIMNYGDGWYGGVFVGAMYTFAFTSSDIPFIIKQALKTIPQQSKYYQCINDVIAWHEKYPADWKQTWFEVQKKWTSDIGCPEGVYYPFDIDATVNSAYVVIGLLYGNGDFSKTIDIAARCGQDADCNPSTAGGVLGTILGYNKIPAYWKMGLNEAESIPFKYTTMSLNDVYRTGLKHALQMISRNGGTVNGDEINIRLQDPQPVRLEQGFEGLFPAGKSSINKNVDDQFSFDFQGTGFVLKGEATSKTGTSLKAELYVDDKLLETADLPTSFLGRRNELFWNYKLAPGKHTVRVKQLNPDPDHTLKASEVIFYDNKPMQKPQTF